MNLYELAVAKALSGSGGGGGGGGAGMDLIMAQSLGHITVSGSGAVDTGVEVVVEGVNDYDFLFFMISADDKTKNGLLMCASVIELYKDGYESDYSDAIKTKAKYIGNPLNYVVTHNSGYPRIGGFSGGYGLYPTSAPTLSNGTLTTNIFGRYSSSVSGAIDNDFTLKVYGINAYNTIQ